jgi:competence protein ComEA
MRINKVPIHNWFGFSRRERRSSFILLIIVVLIIAVRFIVPEKNMAIEDAMISFTEMDSPEVFDSGRMLIIGKPFYFDPNTVSFDSLIKLGLELKEAKTLINYRNKGGKFRQPCDIKKIYGLEKAKAEMLMPFVKIKKSFREPPGLRTFSDQRPLIDINDCDTATLIHLPGIGPVLSVRIIKFRYLLGGYARREQLLEVYGLSDETYDLIKDRLLVDTVALKKIRVNSADYNELSRHPYLDKYEVAAILKYRELEGEVISLDNLIEENLMSYEKAKKVGPYLSFE